MDESNPLKEPLDQMISKGRLKDKEIIFFGANKSTKEMCTYLRSKGFEPYAIVDNDKRKQHQKVAGLATYLPAELLSDYHEKAVILIASEYFKEMSEQLSELGYDREKQIIQVLRLNRFYDTSNEAFEEYAGKARRGEAVYQKLLKEWKERFETGSDSQETFYPSLILCPYPGTGDIYLIGLYLKEYCDKNGIDLQESMITVVGKAAARVFDLFSITNVHVLSQTESDQLLSYVRMMGLKKMRALVCNDGHLQYMTKRFRGIDGINFHTMFRTAVFGMQNDNLEKEGTSSARKALLKKLQHSCTPEVLREKYPSVVEGRSVLLSPYANTVTDVPGSFWVQLAQKMKEEGFQVFTNSIGETEPVIRGTEGVFVPFSEVIDFVEMAGCFIGVRSGLCDIISSASAKKIILYPQGKIFRACSTYDYFSLNKMGLCEDAVELEYGDDGYEKLLEQVLNHIR